MRVALGILIIVFAVSLFLLNLSLGVFPFAESLRIPSFSFEKDREGDSVLDHLVQRLDQERENFSVQELQKKVAAPTPIKVFQQATSAIALDKIQVQVATNAQRQQNGLPPLPANAILDHIARAKARDMFDLQYFAHESPTGKGVGDLADEFGYEYLAIGENLALGNYQNEQALVQAWMDSPGHRANILNEKYREIGIAVAKGNFEGQEVWLAVQTFGVALSVCPVPAESVKNEIEIKKLELRELQILLDVIKEELENTQPKRGQAYQDKVDQFNSLVEQYNKTVAETQTLIKGYNVQVEVFNQCANNGQ
ncbi:MAG TPA: CAP domain-containing protein [Candidatus Paceibacterota bacterium]